VAVKAPAHARRAVPPPYNWSGLYLGANLGGAWSNRTLNVPGAAWDDPGNTALIGGFQLGYNLQAGHFLVGVEGDFDWASFGSPSFTVSSPLGPVQFTDRQKWISTRRGTFWNCSRPVADLRQGRRRLGARQRSVYLPERIAGLDWFKYQGWLALGWRN
jgi:opacity protein-like surface antigen